MVDYQLLFFYVFYRCDAQQASVCCPLQMCYNYNDYDYDMDNKSKKVKICIAPHRDNP